MEVKIKNNEKLIDATIEMVDGIMVVSPKEVRWEPKLIGEVFHFPIFIDVLGRFDTDYQHNDNTRIPSVERGWCFRTKQECQEFCDRLNKALENIKP